MAGIFRKYNALLLCRPMLTQCATASILFTAGDFMAQQVVERKGYKNHDFLRTARMSFYGGALFSPVLQKWYGWLNRLKFSTPTKSVIYRVLLDQTVLAPTLVAFFYTSIAFLELKPEEALPRLKVAYFPTLISNWFVFVPTQTINFAIVPPHLRLVSIGVVGLFWNTYLSVTNAAVEDIAEKHLLEQKG